MSSLKPVATLDLGSLSANIVTDPQGRKCVQMPIGDSTYCFTISQALLFREMLDLALRAMAEYKPHQEEGT